MKILLQEDISADAELIKKYLERGGLKFQVTMVTSKTELIKELENNQYDVLLANHSMPGLEALKMAREQDRNIPFILISETAEEQSAINIVRDEGADDYILIDHLNRLPTAIRQAIEHNKLKRANEICEGKLQEKSLSLLRYLN